MPAPRDTHRQSGLTLVEILVALSIGLFIIGAIIAMFISSRQVYRSRDALTRIQEERALRGRGRRSRHPRRRPARLPELPAAGAPEIERRACPRPDSQHAQSGPPAAPAGSFDFSAMVQGYDAVAVPEDEDPTRRRIPPVDAAGEADADAASWTPALPAAILPSAPGSSGT
ncbi:MAG: prepilin-type N-terminal cleavage/methylation domain-containing protein [Gammaproteobacteria bacterium]|nr:prepilin-type N-terminal cleavage/methylation domain-containing protein [Gammaproteobacteria bacterium]